MTTLSKAEWPIYVDGIAVTWPDGTAGIVTQDSGDQDAGRFIARLRITHGEGKPPVSGTLVASSQTIEGLKKRFPDPSWYVEEQIAAFVMRENPKDGFEFRLEG
jgi:hypothetical protein